MKDESEVIDRGLWLDLYPTGAPPDADRSIVVPTRPSPDRITLDWESQAKRSFWIKVHSLSKQRNIRR